MSADVTTLAEVEIEHVPIFDIGVPFVPSLTVPFTSSLELGAVVPIPTFPESDIDSRVAGVFEPLIVV